MVTLVCAAWMNTAAAGEYKPAKIVLSEDGDQWLRIITWHQVWMRGMELNPGSTVQDEERSASFDVGLRRSRVLLLAQLSSRVRSVTHFGINNQTFNNARKPQLYIHDGWVEADVVPDVLTVGAGLHYWNGVSRMTNASTLNFLALDAPILNWINIERTDQFARQFGIFAKGKVSRLDYRLSLNKPFSSQRELVEGGGADYASTGTLAGAGYFKLELGDQEANLLPYAVGTYLGKKRVLAVGAGAYVHPKSMAVLHSGATEAEVHDMMALGVDLFVDQPVGEGAFTGYLVYYHLDYGPDFVRNVGIMNPGAGGTSFNGGGNAYPVMGTGEHVYGQVGFLIPGTPLQPFVTTQVSAMEALDDLSTVHEAGFNAYVQGHNAKLTVQYRSRPVFEVEPEGVVLGGRASEVNLQTQVFF